MPTWLSDGEYDKVVAACRLMIPADDGPGAAEAGVPDYIDGLLGAFLRDPPHIWAGGPFSGRHGGEASFGTFHALTPLDELAWRTRIEGSLGKPEREFNGPVIGLQERYRAGLEALGDDFARTGEQEQKARLRAHEDFADLLYQHVCEGMYGPPEYGGNKDLSGWLYCGSDGFAGDVQPMGFTDEEVSGP